MKDLTTHTFKVADQSFTISDAQFKKLNASTQKAIENDGKIDVAEAQGILKETYKSGGSGEKVVFESQVTFSDEQLASLNQSVVDLALDSGDPNFGKELIPVIIEGQPWVKIHPAQLNGGSNGPLAKAAKKGLDAKEAYNLVHAPDIKPGPVPKQYRMDPMFAFHSDKHAEHTVGVSQKLFGKNPWELSPKQREVLSYIFNAAQEEEIRRHDSEKVPVIIPGHGWHKIHPSELKGGSNGPLANAAKDGLSAKEAYNLVHAADIKPGPVPKEYRMDPMLAFSSDKEAAHTVGVSQKLFGKNPWELSEKQREVLSAIFDAASDEEMRRHEAEKIDVAIMPATFKLHPSEMAGGASGPLAKAAKDGIDDKDAYNLVYSGDFKLPDVPDEKRNAPMLAGKSSTDASLTVAVSQKLFGANPWELTGDQEGVLKAVMAQAKHEADRRMAAEAAKAKGPGK